MAKEMYKGMPNSPILYLKTDISATATQFTVTNTEHLPDAPNIVTLIGENEADFETVLYTEKTANMLRGVQRGFQGEPKDWTEGTPMARIMTAYDQDAFIENIEENSEAITDINKTLDEINNTVANNSTEIAEKVNLEDVRNYVGVALQSAETIVVEIADLQTTIEALPKWLDRDITIQVKPGTANIDVVVGGFRGFGQLTIRTINASGANVNTVGQSTHQVNKFIIQYNQCHNIYIIGFEAIATSGYCFRLLSNMCSSVELQFIKAVSGSKDTSSFYGVFATLNTYVFIYNVDIANKATAILCESGLYQIRGAGGVTEGDSSYGVTASVASIVMQYDDGISYLPKADTQRHTDRGGIFSNRYGIVTRALYTTAHNANDIGTYEVSWRNLYLAGNIVQPTGNLNYEEGTWTPRLYGITTAGTNTYSTQVGYYVKIGRLVYITMRILLTVKDANMSGGVRIDGLPFRTRNISNCYSVFSVQWRQMSVPLNYIVTPRGALNAYYLDLYRSAATGVATADTSIGSADIQNNTDLFISGCYIA